MTFADLEQALAEGEFPFLTIASTTKGWQVSAKSRTTGGWWCHVTPTIEQGVTRVIDEFRSQAPAVADDPFA